MPSLSSSSLRNPFELKTGSYMEAFARHMRKWFATTGVATTDGGISSSSSSSSSSRYHHHHPHHSHQKRSGGFRRQRRGLLSAPVAGAGVGVAGMGKFLDMGGTGDTRAGMQQSAGKFAQFTGGGILEYWITGENRRNADRLIDRPRSIDRLIDRPTIADSLYFLLIFFFSRSLSLTHNT